MIKAVIFDLDGVLVSTDLMHYEAWKKLAEELGIRNFTLEDNRRQRGISRMASLEVLLEKSDRSYTEPEKEALAGKKNAYYVELLKALTPKDILPGVLNALHELRRRKIPVAVGSASRNAPEILKRTGLDACIDRVSCGLDVTRSKPDPQVFLVAARKLGVEPSVCLVVEDSDSGILAAKNGGMYALAVGAAVRSPLADFHAESLLQADFGTILAD